MLEIKRDPRFIKRIEKIKDASIKEKVKKQINKLTKNPEIGKPMRHARKGTREVYIKPFRLSYLYIKKENKIIFLDLYHKNSQ